MVGIYGSKRTCRTCNGVGRIIEEYTCPHCFGKGDQMDQGPAPMGPILKKCYTCFGTGIVRDEKRCYTCSGTGIVL